MWNTASGHRSGNKKTNKQAATLTASYSRLWGHGRGCGSRCRARVANVIRYLSVSVQRWEVKEKRLSQRNAVDGVVQVVAPVQLHLEGGREAV